MTALLEIYRFLNSYLLISVTGGFPERFLNLCNKERIHLWDINFKDKVVSTKIYCKDFYKLRAIRRKCGVSIKITEKHGLVFWLKARKKRQILLTGMLAAILFMYTMNQFVWFVEVSGNESINKSEIIGTARALGLDRGTFTPTFDKNAAGREIVNLFNGRLLWASVNIKGSKAVIELREYNDTEKESVSDENPCNIIADFDGVIISNETYEGVSNTARGNAVKKGDILISGISENSDGSVNFHTADGKLSAYHKKSVGYCADLSKARGKLIEKEEFSTVNIFSLDIPLSLKAFAAYDGRYEYDKSVYIDRHSLPFGVTKKINTAKISADNNEFRLIEIIDEFTENEYKNMKNTKIIAADYKINNEGNGCKISAEYECIDFIGKKSDILKEN